MPIGGDSLEVAANERQLPLDRDDVVSIMEALFDIRAGVDEVLLLLQEEDDGEAPEEEGQ
ncbi:MAG TPA: hypothetical protein VE615_02820 [Gaiellaceae bacterium]|jgi:hypothetical protein|nr:hypothetical protein [Gaiellaceae bacterium]